MAFLFRHKSKADLAKPTKELLLQLWQSTTPTQKAEDELVRLVAQMKLILQGTHDTESSPEQVAQLVNAMIQEDLLYLLAHSIRLLPFESRKDCQSIFSYAFRFKPAHSLSTEPPALTHVVHRRPEVIVELCRGYGFKESAMPCGVVLRELLKQHEDVASIILHDESRENQRAISIDDIEPRDGPVQSGVGVFWNFFPWIDGGAFEVSTDAFTTFRVIRAMWETTQTLTRNQELLTRHKALVAIYIEKNFELFFNRYNSMLVQSASYVTKRQSIKLLGEILLDRANYSIMTQYVESGEHLKICMTLLKDDRKMVQYEGFHVFKVFVANPNKSPPVQRILVNNRERLLRFLPTFLEDRTEDEQFTDEKSFLIRQIESMGPAPS